MGTRLRVKGASYTPPGATGPAVAIVAELIADNFINADPDSPGEQTYRRDTSCSGFIAIPEGAVMVVGDVNIYKATRSIQFKMYALAFYDENQTFISGADELPDNIGDQWYGRLSANIPQGAKYIRYSYVSARVVDFPEGWPKAEFSFIMS